MRLVFLLFADSAEFTESNKLNLQGAGFQTVLAPGFPVVLHRLVIVCRVEGRTTELGRHVLTVLMVGPDGELIRGPFDLPFVLTRHDLFPYRPVAYTEILEVDVVFPGPGDYAAHVLVDEISLGSEPLYVR